MGRELAKSLLLSSLRLHLLSLQVKLVVVMVAWLSASCEEFGRAEFSALRAKGLEGGPLRDGEFGGDGGGGGVGSVGGGGGGGGPCCCWWGSRLFVSENRFVPRASG